MSSTGRGLPARAVALLVVCCFVGVGVGSVATPASAGTIKLPFENWAVWGSITDKKLGEAITLPKGSTFNGAAIVSKLTNTEIEAALEGKLTVPPFDSTIHLGGLLPTEVALTITEVGELTGSITGAPASSPACANARIQGLCGQMNVTSKEMIGITETGLLGLDVPTECHTAEPVVLELSTIASIKEVNEEGAHFTGSTTIPSITCGGLDGALLGPLITGLMSGPENAYSLHLGPHEPAAPKIEATEAVSVTQVSAQLHALVNPEEEPITGCSFEYGPTSSYGTTVPCVSHPFEEELEHATISGLGEGASYHYRVVATNALGTIDGPDETFSTLTAASAPQYGECVKQKGGAYAESPCRTAARKAGKGKFEWKPGPAATCMPEKKGEYTEAGCKTKSAKPKKGTFEVAPGPGYTSTTGPVTLETEGLANPVTCAAGAAAGEVTSSTGGVDRLTFTGCEMSGTKCTSEGTDATASGVPGTIVTNLLDTRLLGPIAESEQVWTQFKSAEHEPYLAEFGCGTLRLRTAGSVAGNQVGDLLTPSSLSDTWFEPKEGEQALETEASEDGGGTWSSPQPSTLVMTVSNTSASAVEIKP